VKTEEVTVDGKKVEMDLNEWQKFWQVHSMHYDSDAQVMKNISATYLPTTQSVQLSLNEKSLKRDNTRWNSHYKYQYNLTEEESYSGPFGELRSGSNDYTIYQGLPPVRRGELPLSNVFSIK
ncbi:hypothetical protein, partial [Reichenbachiella sp. MALMAid0571]|uniref:hypothetical protein n=1 Tax=Reichenbachiella sp. MALMAid0571 TaxID=3143939 RepID=UPI0032DF85C8